MPIATFGPVVFETSADVIRTFDGLSRSGSARWAAHEVIGQAPITEYLGPELEEISLNIRLDVSFGINPIDEINLLRYLRATGEANTLVIGGQGMGQYVAISVQEEWTRVDRWGRLLIAAVALKLKEYRAQ